MKHEPIVLERGDWRVTKAACSCGAELQLAGNVGSVREQFQKLVAAFQKHMIQKETARQKPAAANRSVVPPLFSGLIAQSATSGSATGTGRRPRAVR